MATSSAKKAKEVMIKMMSLHVPEHPELKDGFGHDIEHIKGVYMRGMDITRVINSMPYQFGIKVDLNIVGMALALHDYGNLISRKGHNHFGFGILKGDLNIEDIIQVPMELHARGGSIYVTQKTMDEVEEYLLNYDESLRFIDELSEFAQKVIINAAILETKFHIGYDNIQPEFLETYLVSHFDIDPDSELIQTIEDSILKPTVRKGQSPYRDIEYGEDLSKQLHEMTQIFHDMYPDDSVAAKLIREAVQDHNVDFERKRGAKENTRYTARSIYGMIVADADKDCVPETFATRSYCFGRNKLGLTDKDEIIMNVLEQANDRYRPSAEEFGRVMPVMPSHLEHKRICEIKCARLVDEDLEKQLIKDNREDEIITLKENIGPNVAGTKYIITRERGDDIYSQVDTAFNSDIVSDLWKDFTETTMQWGDPNKVDQSMSEIRDIIDTVLEPAKSIEAAVDILEKDFWSNRYDTEIKDYSFEGIIKDAIPDDYVGIYDQMQDNIAVLTGSSDYDQDELEQEVFEGLSVPGAENLDPSGNNFKDLNIDVALLGNSVVLVDPNTGELTDIEVASFDNNYVLYPNNDVIVELMEQYQDPDTADFCEDWSSSVESMEDFDPADEE